MNKKFYTLVSALLLSTGIGAYAASDIATLTPSKGTITAVAAYDETSKVGGYEVGKSYLLGNDQNLYLTVEAATKEAEAKLKFVNITEFDGLTEMHKALWTVQAIVSPEGALAPKYVFVNKYTGTVLALDKSDAVKANNGTVVQPATVNSVMGGDITEWLSAPAYKNPGASLQPMYSTLKGDSVAVMTLDANNYVFLNKMKKAELSFDGNTPTSNVAYIKPYKVENFTLSANDLNTQLGVNADKNGLADKTSTFQLTFDPSVLNGDVFAGQQLQAEAVNQFELQYKEEKSSKVVVESAYASLYPVASKLEINGTNPAKYSDLVDPANSDAYRNTEAQYLALKNADGKYIVVDTAYVAGTDNNANGLIKLTTDGLYNAKNETKYREPSSYLFKFTYNPTEGTVSVAAKSYIRKTATQNPNATTVDKDFYGDTNPASGYASKATKQGSNWYVTTDYDGTTPANINAGGLDDQNVDLTRVLLGSTNYLTLGTNNPGNVGAESNILKVYIGTPAIYAPTSVASGAYLIKIVGSKDASKIGKYWVNNLKGGFEVMEQAVRQNFQHMPAAQWIVESNGTIAGSPVTITNREFGKDGGKATVNSGVLYAAANGAFFFGQDTLSFVPVADPTNAYLGYKHLTDSELAENVYTFNYLHALGMDKPINTKNDKDSVIWVDGNDNSTKFQLIPVVKEDTYGYNGGLKGVAQLKRDVYYVKVNDATKLQNDKRYLTYDEDLKKYVVSQFTPDIKNGYFNTAANPDAFFLKENNEVTEGAVDYYAFVKANILPVVKDANDHDAKYMVTDADVQDLFNAKKGTYTDAQTGLSKTGWVVNGSAISTASAKNYSEAKISVDNNTLDLVNGVLNNEASKEVATSAFAIKVDDSKLYRRFNTENEGIASDAADTVKFYRVNATEPEFLYEDAYSKYSADKDFNFLGVEGKGDAKNAAMYVDTAYVRNNTKMPQYLIFVNPTVQKADTTWCNATEGHKHATLADSLACPHTIITPAFVEGRLLVNLQDSVDANTGAEKEKYQWNKAYTRLGFVEARHINDTVVIKNTNDSIFVGDNTHKKVVFSFRLIDNATDNFLIESVAKDKEIAPEVGGWVKIQNGVPVIAEYSTYNEAALDAEVFNVQATSEAPTANDEVSAEAGVSVIASNGAVIIKNAAGKKVVIANILGKALANETVASDNETIAVPAGIVVVSVEGEEAAKVVVK